MGYANLCAALRARLDGRDDPVRMVSFLLRFVEDRTSPTPPFPHRLCTPLNTYYLALLVISRRTYVDNKLVVSVFS